MIGEGAAMIAFFLALVVAPVAIPQTAHSAYLPDRRVTPGALNPAVTQANIGSNICLSGWTKTIRPQASYTNKLKIVQMKAFGLVGNPRLWEEDHFIPLEAGGNPTSPSNLWPQKWSEPWGAHRKDVLETKIKHLICDGKLSLADGQHAIQTDWIAAYLKYVGPPK